jgi:hypothetical protein
MKRTLLGVVGLVALAVVAASTASAGCQDEYVAGGKLVNGRIGDPLRATPVGRIAVGQCWKDWTCKLCDDNKAHLAQKCNTQYSVCEDNCAACGISVYNGLAFPCYEENSVKVMQ